MGNENQESRLQLRQRTDGVLVVEGELNQCNAEAFESALASLNLEPNGEIVLVMFDFDVDDGIGIATAINALRDLLKRAGKLKLISAPQILCHNLYRVGMLGTEHAIELIDMREDEPYG